MGELMISISGVRGIVGESLTPELVMRMGEAFGSYVGGPQGREKPPTVVVGRDTRVSGEMVKHSVLAGLLSTGCEIVDLGVVTTPTAAIMIEELGAAGGVVISASHNPIEWNALKFFGSDGGYLDAEQGRQLLDLYYQGDFRHARWHQIRQVRSDERAAGIHLAKVLEVVDVEAIRASKFRVALDSCNGAGVEITTRLLDELGCELTRIHCTPDGLFPHDPEPKFVNLQDLCKLTAESDVDAAFAQDPDADRLAVLDETGRFIGEEYTLALAADYVLACGDDAAGDDERKVVINMSTSRAVEDVAARHGASCERVPVGEVNVAVRMRELGAVIGGEGNGGVIDPRVHYGRDSLVGIVLILEHMAKSGRKLSELVAELPCYYIEKIKVELPRAEIVRVLDRLVAEAQPDIENGRVRANDLDGLRLDWDDRWVHVRPSNTEPVVRIIAEACEAGCARELSETFAARVCALAGKEKA